MPIESERKCGYRQVGGLYLVGSYITIACDRLPLLIPVCPCCGEHPRFTRGIAEFSPWALFGAHDLKTGDCLCDTYCVICYPGKEGWLMWVGKDYSKEEFILEGIKLGVSKRIPFIPPDFQIGKDTVYLAKKNLIKINRRKYDAIFTAFKPQHIEYLIEKKNKYTQAEIIKAQRLVKQGATLIEIPRTPENEVHFSKKREHRQKPKDKIIPLEDVWDNESDDLIYGEEE